MTPHFPLTVVCPSLVINKYISRQHLNRVQEHSASNRMNAGNLAIIFGSAPLPCRPSYLLFPFNVTLSCRTYSRSETDRH